MLLPLLLAFAAKLLLDPGGCQMRGPARSRLAPTVHSAAARPRPPEPERQERHVGHPEHKADLDQPPSIGQPVCHLRARPNRRRWEDPAQRPDDRSIKRFGLRKDL